MGGKTEGCTESEEMCVCACVCLCPALASQFTKLINSLFKTTFFIRCQLLVLGRRDCDVVGDMISLHVCERCVVGSRYERNVWFFCLVYA